MNLLPWLLNWPPRPAAIVAFLFVTAFSVGTLVLFAPITDQINPDEATVEASNVSIHLNDEITMPDIENGTVATCMASGTPGDHLTVRADILVETPMEDGDDSPYDVEVSIGNDSRTTTEPIQQTGRDRVDVFWVVRDDESLSVGDTADIHIHLRESETVVSTVTRTVTVKKDRRSYDCESYSSVWTSLLTAGGTVPVRRVSSVPNATISWYPLGPDPTYYLLVCFTSRRAFPRTVHTAILGEE